jgi:hypothetical protein
MYIYVKVLFRHKLNAAGKKEEEQEKLSKSKTLGIVYH